LRGWSGNGSKLRYGSATIYMKLPCGLHCSVRILSHHNLYSVPVNTPVLIFITRGKETLSRYNVVLSAARVCPIEIIGATIRLPKGYLQFGVAGISRNWSLQYAILDFGRSICRMPDLLEIRFLLVFISRYQISLH